MNPHKKGNIPQQNSLIEQVSKQTRLQVGYWPIFSKGHQKDMQREAYWISPFLGKGELEVLKNELLDNKPLLSNLKILLDFEFPLNKVLLLKNFLDFWHNKQKIEEIFEICMQNGAEIITTEYPANRIIQPFLEKLGLSYPPKKAYRKQLIMYYTSVIHKLIPSGFNTWYLNTSLHTIREKVAKYGNAVQVGVGELSSLSPKQLTYDLSVLQNIGVTTLCLFRLGDLASQHIKAIKHFIKEQEKKCKE